MYVESGPSARLGKRPRARWYLLAVLSGVAAVGCLLASIGFAIWQDRSNLGVPDGQVKLAQSRTYDVYGQAVAGDHVACSFTPVAGGEAFTQTFDVPPQHRHHLRHQHVFLHWTNQLGSFTAGQSGTFRIQCTNNDKVIYSGASQQPYGYVNVLIWVTVLLGAFTVLWPAFLFRLRRRSGGAGFRRRGVVERKVG